MNVSFPKCKSICAPFLINYNNLEDLCSNVVWVLSLFLQGKSPALVTALAIMRSGKRALGCITNRLIVNCPPLPPQVYYSLSLIPRSELFVTIWGGLVVAIAHFPLISLPLPRPSLPRGFIMRHPARAPSYAYSSYSFCAARDVLLARVYTNSR